MRLATSTHDVKRLFKLCQKQKVVDVEFDDESGSSWHCVGKLCGYSVSKNKDHHGKIPGSFDIALVFEDSCKICQNMHGWGEGFRGMIGGGTEGNNTFLIIREVE